MSIFNSHARYEALVTEHIDGLLDADGEAKLEQHLETCAECAAEVAEQQALVSILRAEPMVAAPRSFALPYAPRTVDAPVSRVSRLLRSMQVATAAAALVLVFLVGINIVEGPGAIESANEAATQQRLAGFETDNFVTSKTDDQGLTYNDVDGAIGTPVPSFAPGEQEFVSSPPPAVGDPNPETVGAGRSGIEWALIAMSGFVGVLALGVVAATWMPRRSH